MSRLFCISFNIYKLNLIPFRYEQYKERKAERDAKYRVKKMREENEEWNSAQISDKEGNDDDDDDSSEPGDYAIPKNTDDLSTSSEDDSETEESFSSKDKVNKNIKLVTDLNDGEDEEKTRSSDGL